MARNRGITSWVQDRLAYLREHKGPAAEEGFVVHGTMADPRWLDPTIDPNDRKPNWCYMGDPQMVNNAPAGLPGSAPCAVGCRNGVMIFPAPTARPAPSAYPCRPW